MGFKKFDGSTWQPINPKQLKGIPYTGTLPATLSGTKAGYLHGYKIYGNTEQTGTPTPENPIVPSECGERTENLFPESSISGKSSAVRSTFNTLAANIDFQADKQYSLRIKTDTEESAGVFRVTFTYSDGTTKKTGYITKTVQSVSLTSSTGKTVESLSITDYNAYTDITLSEITVIEGSTAPTSFIPYGYKLPLTSSGQNVDIYLGDEPLRKIGNYADYIDYGTGKIVRQVGKVVLTGTETINSVADTPYNTKAISYYYTNLGMTDIINYNKTMVSSSYPSYGSTHFVTKSHGRNSWTDINDGEIGANGYAGALKNVFLIFGTSYQTQEEFKQFLANQYTAGTPVEIWYPLETPTDENPPVPFPQIPTSANSTTISWAGEGLAPSQFDSIQEWVDIPTYKRVNGEWVEDN